MVAWNVEKVQPGLIRRKDLGINPACLLRACLRKLLALRWLRLTPAIETP